MTEENMNEPGDSVPPGSTGPTEFRPAVPDAPGASNPMVANPQEPVPGLDFSHAPEMGQLPQTTPEASMNVLAQDEQVMPIAKADLESIARVLGSEDSTAEDVAKAMGKTGRSKKEIVTMLKDFGYPKADEVEEYLKDKPEPELAPKAGDADRIIEDPDKELTSFERTVEANEKGLNEIGEFDEQQYADELRNSGLSPDEQAGAVGEMQRLKTRTRPIFDKFMEIKGSKGFRIGQYVLLTIIIAFLLTTFGLLKAHTAGAGGGKNR